MFRVGGDDPRGCGPQYRLLSPEKLIVFIVSMTSLGFLVVLGGLSACAGGAPMARAMVRVTFWGALALGLTAGVGALFGVAA
jgi:VIT1/CCC1 family predicted Fe2+/Mn2+ transporter